jgi:oxalate---CoA ligase
MKRAAICVPDPWNYIDQYKDYSLIIINPGLPQSRVQYLLEKADWSLLVTADQEQHRSGGTYPDEKLLWYTSGTTGDSKFYSVSQRKIDHVCDRLISDYNITNNDRYVSVMPLWHGHGQMFYWLAKKVGFEINFLPVSKLTQLKDYSPTFITAIPDILKIVARLELNQLRFIRSASSALPNSFFHDLSQRFGIPVIEAFGMTEATSHCFTNPLDGEQRIGTVGLPSGIEARVDNNRLYIKGPAVCKDDWLDTGDLAEIDEQGYYRILGRVQDTITVRGYKINPVSIEYQLVSTLPGIGECVVFGTNKLKCLYTGDISPHVVSNFLTSLSIYCKPVMVQQVEKIPVNSMGKISRSMLIQEFQ